MADTVETINTTDAADITDIDGELSTIEGNREDEPAVNDIYGDLSTEDGKIMGESSLQSLEATLASSYGVELYLIPPFWNFTPVVAKAGVKQRNSPLNDAVTERKINLTSMDDIFKPVKYKTSKSAYAPDAMLERLKESTTIAKDVYISFYESLRDGLVETSGAEAGTGATPIWVKCLKSDPNSGEFYRNVRTGEVIYFKGGSIFEGASDFGGVICVANSGDVERAVEDCAEFDQFVTAYYNKISGMALTEDMKTDREGSKLAYSINRIEGCLKILNFQESERLFDRLCVRIYGAGR